MAQITIQQQEELMQRTKKFVAKYGISKKWLASKVGISVRDFCCLLTPDLLLLNINMISYSVLLMSGNSVCPLSASFDSKQED